MLYWEYNIDTGTYVVGISKRSKMWVKWHKFLSYWILRNNANLCVRDNRWRVDVTDGGPRAARRHSGESVRTLLPNCQSSAANHDSTLSDLLSAMRKPLNACPPYGHGCCRNKRLQTYSYSDRTRRYTVINVEPLTLWYWIMNKYLTFSPLLLHIGREKFVKHL